MLTRVPFYPFPPTYQPAPYLHPHTRSIVVVPTRDGRDYVKVCARHQWAARPCVSLSDAVLTLCPQCELELSFDDGRIRYAVLHARLASESEA